MKQIKNGGNAVIEPILGGGGRRSSLIERILGIVPKKILAFTLAEVLIALTIIGVVAALTVPTMIQSYQEKATVAKLRTVYSTLNQALYMSKIDNGPIDTWDWGAGDGPSSVNVFREYFKPYLRVQKDCGTGTGCWYDGMTKSLQGSDYFNFDTASDRSKVFLVNNTSLAFSSYGSCNNARGTSRALQHMCGIMIVDINGEKSPNTFGKDEFSFWITTDGVVPYGTPDGNDSLSNRCNLNSTNSNNGDFCTAWVIEKGNMDYLRKEVSW